jgi:hypothetical protein
MKVHNFYLLMLIFFLLKIPFANQMKKIDLFLHYYHFLNKSQQNKILTHQYPGRSKRCRLRSENGAFTEVFCIFTVLFRSVSNRIIGHRNMCRIVFVSQTDCVYNVNCPKYAMS